jgi:hypothetical protein
VDKEGHFVQHSPCFIVPYVLMMFNLISTAMHNLCLCDLNGVKFVVTSCVLMHLEFLAHVILLQFIILVT